MASLRARETRTRAAALVFAAAACTSIGTASAVVTFAFADKPGPNGQFVYNGPSGPGELGSLVYDSTVRVKLSVDATGEGGSEFHYYNTTFHFSASVGAIVPVASSTAEWIAPLTDGSLDFQDSNGNLLFSGTFGIDLPAALVVVINTGSVNASVEVGGLNYVPGQTLLNDLSASIGMEVLGFLPPFDGVWTLSNMTALKTVVCPAPGPCPNQIFLDDFSANSSFSGTAGIEMIPAPGASVLAGIGLLAVVSRRRR